MPNLFGVDLNSPNPIYSADFFGYSYMVIAYGKGDGTFVNGALTELNQNGAQFNPFDFLFMDSDGDGYVEIFSKWNYYYNSVNGYDLKSYKLKKVVDGMNNTTEFDYKSLNSYNDQVYTPNYDAVFPVIDYNAPLIAVSKITRSNGHKPSIVEKYHYEGAKLHALGRGFLGFTKTSVSNLSTATTSNTTNLLNLGYYVMLPFNKSIDIGSNSGIFTESYSFSLNSLGGKRFLAKMTHQSATDGLNNTVKNMDYTYDNYNNVLTSNTSVGNFSVQVTNQYGAFGSTINNKIISAVVTNTNSSGSVTRTETFTYDTKGNLLTITKDPSNNNEVKTTYSGYNAFGNPTSVSVTESGTTDPRIASYTYTQDGRFVETSTDNFDKTTFYDYDFKWGVAKKVTDFNNRSVESTIDNWGRVSQTKYADGKYQVSALRWAEGGGPANAAFYSYQEVSGSAPVLTWFDKSGKELRTQSKGFNAQDVYVDKQYDDLGRAYKVSDPYYSSSSAAFNQSAFDEYGRVVSQTLSTGDVVTTTYGSRTVTVVAPNSNSTQTVNEMGQVTEVKDNKTNQTVSYLYYANGLLKSTKPSTGPAITMEYDLQGNRTMLNDPDAGTITSEYNGFGELIWQQDAKGSRTTPAYNNKGLVTSLTRGSEPAISYIYDTDNRVSTISNGTHTQGFTYDDFDRVTKVTETIDGKTFIKEVQFNSLGFPIKEIYPSGYYITNHYDAYGMLIEIKDSTGSIWQLNSVSALGQIGSIIKGNGKTTSYTYDAHHRPYKVETTGIAEFEYSFDAITGNLTSRKDIKRNLTETFTYDNLDRLTGARIGNNPNYLNMAYEPGGNILRKTDAGKYIYNPNIKPHAITQIDSLVNPPNIPSINQDITYNAFNMVQNIKEGNYDLTFTYGVDNQRRKTVLKDGTTVVKTKYYMANYEEETTGSGTRKIHYIAGGDGLAGVLIKDNANPAGKMYYTYSDHLGSIVAITDANGTVVQEQSFDPWGRRRNYTNWLYPGAQSITLIDRGYTGHEHLNEFSIINMNGRLYDPVLGRILSPDPALQMPGNTQNFNRYSYCLNNPLKYTDPSGYLAAPLNQFWNLDKTFTQYIRFHPNWDGMDGGQDGWGAGGGGALPAWARPGEDNFYSRHTYIEGTKGSGWVDNKDIIDIDSNNPYVFDENEESLAILYMMGLALQTGKEVLGFFTNNAEGNFIIVLPVEGIAVRKGEFYYKGELQEIEIGNSVQNKEDGAKWSYFLIDITKKNGKTVIKNLYGNDYEIDSYIHTHPKDPKDCLGGQDCFYHDALSPGDYNFAKEINVPVFFCLELETQHILYGRNDGIDRFLINPDTNDYFTIRGYAQYLENGNSSLIYPLIK